MVVAIVLMAVHTENYWNLFPLVFPVLLVVDEQMTRILVQENGDIWLKRGFSGSIKAYGVATHRHTPEIEEQLGYAAGSPVVVSFTPHLVPMQRGILVTAYASLKREVTWEEVKAVYDRYYDKERFVRVLDQDVCPQTRWVEGSNYVDVGFKIDPRTKRIIMMGAMDNLVKGAAGQAVQNMNLVFGLDEAEGLRMAPLFP